MVEFSQPINHIYREQNKENQGPQRTDQETPKNLKQLTNNESR